jgi:hypothetical protein
MQDRESFDVPGRDRRVWVLVVSVSWLMGWDLFVFLSGAQAERRLGIRVWFRTTMHSPQDFFVFGTIGVEYDGFERN